MHVLDENLPASQRQLLRNWRKGQPRLQKVEWPIANI